MRAMSKLKAKSEEWLGGGAAGCQTCDQ